LKFVAFTLLVAGLGAAATVDIYTPQDQQAIEKKLLSSQKGSQFSSETLKKYGNHYTMMAHRDATGSSELHQKESDVFFVVEGSATLVTGGELLNGKTTNPGEIRGTSIKGGERHALVQGSVVHIPAGTPHQLLVEKGQPFTYFVVKVID